MSKSIDATRFSDKALTKCIYHCVREIGSAGGGQLIANVVDDDGAIKMVITTEINPLSKKQLKDLDQMEKKALRTANNNKLRARKVLNQTKSATG